MTTTQYRNKNKEDKGPSARKGLPLRVRLYLLLVPAIIGFTLAYLILLIMGPFGTVIEWFLWLFIAIVVSLAASLVAGDAVRRQVKNSQVYKDSNQFDTQVDELFGVYLREGNARALRKDAVALGHSPEFIDEVIRQIDALTKHDRLTRGHVERVRAYASLIGCELGLAEAELELLNWTALLHDIGKLDVPPSILNSPGKPSPEEWVVLRGHPAAAKGRLAKLEEEIGEGIYDGALYHHERWDGNGYPHGLKMGEIPLFGRITAIADAFDVMTHARSYKKPMPIAQARQELMSSAGTQFDPDLVTAFVRIGDQELKSVRGWSATFAGVAVAGTRLLSFGSKAVVVVATAIGAGIGALSTDDSVPEAVAFTEPVVETTTTITPETTTTAAPETTTAAPTTTVAEPTTSTSIESSTTTSTTIIIESSTTVAAPAPPPSTSPPVEQRLLTVTYQITSNFIDGVEVSVTADELVVYFDGEQHSVHELAPGQQTVPVVFDVTGLPEQNHVLRFDLFENGVLVSSDQTTLFG